MIHEIAMIIVAANKKIDIINKNPIDVDYHRKIEEIEKEVKDMIHLIINRKSSK